ncbi:MAG: transporter, partial [Candidatus Saccharicenans sp.]|nr:transporter [Candidatus Saccharicenans sp.]
ATIIFVLAVCLLAPKLGDPRFRGIFNYIQEFQGFVSPGVLAAFGFGLFIKRTPPAAGVTALVLSVPVYGFLKWQFGDIAFLNRIAINFIVLVVVMAIITLVKPLSQPKELPVQQNFDLRSTPVLKSLCAAIIILTIALYIIFW